ncbi:MAG: InlB B-repeat-containing protein, partial [Lachnospiraceae bacterium]|nr:InlB B-repeat-containing protein [Lachnospiraceae bacterium]
SVDKTVDKSGNKSGDKTADKTGDESGDATEDDVTQQENDVEKESEDNPDNTKVINENVFGDDVNYPMVILDKGKYGVATRIAGFVDTDEKIGKSTKYYDAFNVLTDEETEELVKKSFNYPALPSTCSGDTLPVFNICDTLPEFPDMESTTEDMLFNGWYKDKECTIPWDFDSDIVVDSGDTILYAGWIESKMRNWEQVVEEKKQRNNSFRESLFATKRGESQTVSKDVLLATVIVFSSLCVCIILFAVVLLKRKR